MQRSSSLTRFALPVLALGLGFGAVGCDDEVDVTVLEAKMVIDSIINNHGGVVMAEKNLKLDKGNLEAIRATEAEISAAPRFRIPQERIADVASGIQNGDIIAATSTVDGLDVAHTGLALWVEGELHLMHAPLVGEAVQVSPVSLAERIQRIDGQDGLMVARAMEPRRIR